MMFSYFLNPQLSDFLFKIKTKLNNRVGVENVILSENVVRANPFSDNYSALKYCVW